MKFSTPKQVCNIIQSPIHGARRGGRMYSKNTYFIIFWLAILFLILGYLCFNKTLNLEPKYITCFSITAFFISVSSFLSELSEEFEEKSILKYIFDMIIYLFMGISMISLIVIPLILKNQDFSALNNTMTLWSLGIIFLSIALKEINNKLKSQKKLLSKIENVEKNLDKLEQTMENEQEFQV